MKYLGVESSCHKYLVRLFVHDKGKPRKVKEENLTRSFRGYSSFEDVIEVEERRKLRTSSDRVEIRDLRIERRMMKREAKELRMKIEILKKQSSNLAREKEEWRKEMKEFQVCKLFSWKRPAGNETVIDIRNYLKDALKEKDAEVQRHQRRYDNIFGLYKKKVEELREVAKEKGALDKLKARYDAVARKDKTHREELSELQLELDVCQKQLSLTQELEAERVLLAKENKVLKGKVESLKRCVEDLTLDLDSQNKKVISKEEADKTFLRLFSGGLSVAEVMMFIREMRTLLGDKVELNLKGEKKTYLNDLRRDLCVVNRIIVAYMIGKCTHIRQIDHDDSNIGKTTISSTFVSVKMPDREQLVDLFIDVAGIPEGKSAVDGAEFIIREFSRMQQVLDDFKAYLRDEGEHELAASIPDGEECSLAKAAHGCMECADNAATAQAKSILLMRRIFAIANPQIANEVLDSYTNDEIRMAMRFYNLGCIIHERCLMLNEASNADDKWLAEVCEQDFHSQERVDMSLTKYLFAVNKDFHESYSKGAAGTGHFAAFHRVKCPHLPLMSLPTPGPGNRFDITAYLAFATLINHPVYVAYLYKSELLGNMESVKDGTLNKAIRLRVNSSEFFACLVVRGQFYWHLIQPLTWLQSTKEVTEDGVETGRRVLLPYRTPQMYQKIIDAMATIVDDPDVARTSRFKIFEPVGEYEGLQRHYDHRSSQKLTAPDGSIHDLAALVESRIYRRFDDRVEEVIHDRMIEFAKNVMASIQRNASSYLEGGIISSMIQEEVDLSIFDYCHADSVATSESGFADVKRHLKKLVSANISTGNGSVVYERNGGFDLVDFPAKLEDYSLSFSKLRRPEARLEQAEDKRLHDEKLERCRAEAEAKHSQSMRDKLIKAYKYHSLRKLTSRDEMIDALSLRRPGKRGANVEKSHKEFLTNQYKAYCYAGGWQHKPLSSSRDAAVGSLEDLKGRLCEIFDAIADGSFVYPDEPSLKGDADEIMERDRIEGMHVLSHNRDIVAEQFIGPLPEEVEALKILNSYLPDVELPWDCVEVNEWKVLPPEELIQFRPGQIFQDNTDGMYMAFRGFYYNEKLNDFTIYYHEDANLEGALERHNVVRSSLECDYCYYARLGNDYRYIGAFHDLYEQF